MAGTGAPPEASEGWDTGILQVSATERHRKASSVPHKLLAALTGRRTPPYPSYTGLVEQAEAGKIGIACSGGGIRSAAFGLGALQVLQTAGVLERARYLAGVSGGSYIAAAFCMVKRCWQTVTPAGQVNEPPAYPQAGWDDSDPAKVESIHPPFFPGSPEEQYLRNRSSYLAPGAFGKLQFGYRLVLGMGLNLLFIALALAALAAPLSLLYRGIYPALAPHVGAHGLCAGKLCQITPLSISTGMWITLSSIAGLAILAGGASIVAYRWRSSVAEAVQVLSLWLLLLAGLLGFLLIGLPVLLSLVRSWGSASELPGPPKTATGAHGLSTLQVAGLGAGGITTFGSTVLLQLRAEWAEARRIAVDLGKAKKWYAGLGSRLRRGLVYALAALVGPAFCIGVALAAMTITLNLPDPWERWALAGGLAVFFLGLYTVADLTTWSLHSFYRRRLCSAFALKRVASPAASPPIAPDDAGRAVERKYEHLVPLSHTGIPPVDGKQRWPTLLVCAAANISDTAATPPGRRVTSFTFSATAMGGPLIGSVSTAELEKSCDKTRKSYFTLPAAVAMSGAALSPSMGKMTRWPLRFLMALANVRLGVWVPNPRRLPTFEQSAKKRREDGRFYPLPRLSYLLRELLGINSIDADFLYVTDGGHYENLGLVELLRRGCTEIYCFDASNDDFTALGDAVSLARSELNVQIDVDYTGLKVDPKTLRARTDCVRATITYPSDPPLTGTLYYARLVMTSKPPTDALAYQGVDPHFPHDPTTDQLYTDQRFEAYRALGAHAANSALAQRPRSLPSGR
jgi:hypothetical protein